MQKNTLLAVYSFFIMLGCLSSCQNKPSESEEPISVEESISHQYYLDIITDSLIMERNSIRSGENLGEILNRYGVSTQQVETLCQKAKPVFDIRRIRAGANYTILRDSSANTASYFVYEQNKRDHVVFDLADTMRVYNYEKPVSYKPDAATGVIESSLWNAIHQSGQDVMLSDLLSELYAWQIDFFGIAKGDNFKVLYEQAYIDDTTKLHIERIKGAVFTHHGETFYAIPFHQDSVTAFFDDKGESLRKAFLKAPLKFSRISSGFSHARRHPILKIVRPHHGVDYAAPTGTPVRTIGDGIVTHKAFQRGGAGYYLKIKHNANYVTTYMHLSGYAKGIQVGSRVAQGEVIGYVGSTGGSTGPHLDFRVHFNGKPINPLKMKSPPSIPVKETLRDSFDIVKKDIILQLDSLLFANQTAQALM